MHKAICVGGPMAGQTITTRSPIGFVAVDAAGAAAWLYYVETGTGCYLLDTGPDPSSLDPDGTRALDRDRALDAAQIKGLDVIALTGDVVAAAPPPVFDDGGGEEGQD